MYLLILILLIGVGLINPIIELVKKIRKVPVPQSTEQTKIKGYIINFAWSLGLILLFSMLCIFAGINFYDIGLREISQNQNIWFTAILLVIYVFMIFAVYSMLTYLFNPSVRRKENEEYKNKWEQESLPRSRKEKIYWLFTSLGTSICDEFVFRGVLFFLLQTVFPNIPMLVLLAATSILCGIRHANQGFKGIAGNAYGGALLGSLFLVTGSLIPGMILRFSGAVSRAFPLTSRHPDIMPEIEEQNIVECTEIIEGDEYVRKEIDWNEKVAKIALYSFTIFVTVICLILLHLSSSESVISVFVNMLGRFRLVHILVIIAAVIINFACIGVHEVLHAIFFAPFQKNGFKSIKIGSNQIAYFCETKEPIKVKQYIIGLVAPTIIMGVIPVIIAIATGNIYLLLFGWWMTVGGNGDFMILVNVLKYDKDTWLLVAASEEEIYYYQAKSPALRA